MATGKKILVIDETLREGMQYKGVMFSFEQRCRILQFQEMLGVDICQAGYPPAHKLEAEIVGDLSVFAQKKSFKIRIAAMGRTTEEDTKILLDTGADELHFHIHIKDRLSASERSRILEQVLISAKNIKARHPDKNIYLALLDIGKTDSSFLLDCVSFLDSDHIDILSLPDTSGIMAPNQVFETIKTLADTVSRSAIGIHTHNDMGMASANAVMGILAGGQILEASVLGIGERNGIADLFTTARHLKNQGIHMRLDTRNMDTFTQYYAYVDDIIFQQTGEHLLTAGTPVFGEATGIHTAGTHALNSYGRGLEERFFLNVLCGKRLVRKYMDQHQIEYPAHLLDRICDRIKIFSIQNNKAVTKEDIQNIISEF